MRSSSRMFAAVLSLVGATALAQGEGEPMVVGVFLPVSVANGQERLQAAEGIASKLQEALGVPVTGRSFGRFQDFSEALSSGAITAGLVDGWVAGQLPAVAEVVAVSPAADKQRLQLVAKTKKSVPELKGSNVAIVRGTPGQEAKAASNLFFLGDLQAQKHFKLVSVPNTESALEAVEAGAADAAVLPAGSAKGLSVLYSGPSIPMALVVKGKKALPAGFRDAVLKVAVSPLERFTVARGDELADLRTLTQRGPPRRTPVMAESPPERFDVGLLDFAAVETELPQLSPSVSPPQESPDD